MIPFPQPSDFDLPKYPNGVPVLPYNGPSYDAPRYPDHRPTIPLINMPPDFRDQRRQHDLTPQPPYPPALYGSAPQTYTPANLQDLLNRLFG